MTLRRAVGCLCVGLGVQLAQAQPAPRPDTPAAKAEAARQEKGPRWQELSGAQRQALKPLAGSWSSLPSAQKRKWIALSRNFGKMPKEEQAKLHERMGEWVALSAAERNEARLNYATIETLSPDDKQAKWLEYQALSDDERHRLAEQAPRPPISSAAVAIRPVAPARLARTRTSIDNAPMPRIPVAPHLIHPLTLLPQVDHRGIHHESVTRP